MAPRKQTSKTKGRVAALPILGAAGLSLTMAGEAAAAVAPISAQPGWGGAGASAIILDEEELSDVILGRFYVLDQEDGEFDGVQLAQRRGGGGCRGCAAARCGGGSRCAVSRCGGSRCAVARCGAARCAVARCGRCGCACSGCSAPCWTWSYSRWAYVC
jgi:hypothetical protein